MSFFKRKNKSDYSSEIEICRRREAAIKIIEKNLSISNITGIFMGNRERLDKLIISFDNLQEEDNLRFIQKNLKMNNQENNLMDKFKKISEEIKQVI